MPASLLAVRSPALALFTFALLIAGCQRPRSEGREVTPTPSAATSNDASASAASAPTANTAGLAGPHAARWREALADPDDELLLARLADAEGASGLLDALDSEAPVAAVALAAMPRAPDAELAAGPLAARLPAARGADLDRVLGAIEGVVQRPRTQTERLDLPGWRGCYEALVALARREDVPAATRARAVSAARSLQERVPPPYLPLPATFDR